MTATGLESRIEGIAGRLRRGHRLFYVQREPRSVWHVESSDDPELMLCGERISVDLDTVKVQIRPGPKFCLWCEEYLKRARSSSQESLDSPGLKRTTSSPQAIQTTLRDVTTRTGSGS